jgi:hypothetical protein
MIDAGLPLVQCLDILANQSENPASRQAVPGQASVEQGSSFSDALRKHPKIFDELYVNLVGAGEVGGILDTILNRLATYIEKAVKLKSQLKSAMVYPIAIMVVADRRHRGHARQGHPDLRGHVQELRRRQAAEADPGRHRHLALVHRRAGTSTRRRRHDSA